jgi:DNA-binding GntR family transcriptional regulator
MADVDDLFDLRAILESGAIRQAVLRATAQRHAALERLSRRHEGIFAIFRG